MDNLTNLEMQIDSMASEVKYKTEQVTRLTHEGFAKDTELSAIKTEIEKVRAENARL